MTGRERLLCIWKRLDAEHRKLVIEVATLAYVRQARGERLDFGDPLLAVPRPAETIQPKVGAKGA